VNGLFFGHRVVGFFFLKAVRLLQADIFFVALRFPRNDASEEQCRGVPMSGGSHRAGLIFVYYHYYSIGVSSTNFLQKKKKRKQSSTASADVRGSVLAPQRAPDQGPESCALLSARFPVSTKTDFSMWDL